MRAILRDSRTVGAGGKLEVPLRDRDYGVWSLAERPIQAGGNHHWRTGVHLGPSVPAAKVRMRRRP